MEYDVTIENDVVTSKTRVVSVVYVYNHEGELVKKKAVYPDGSESGNIPTRIDDEAIDSSQFYVTADDLAVDVITTTDTDELGRKTSDSVGKTAGDIVRSFTYVEGLDPTELGGYNEHVLSQNEVNLAELKYKPTTQLVKDITVTNSEGEQIHTFYYEYDEEERIKKLVETYTVNGEAVTNTTEYEYDALGQLLTEKKNGTVINSMTYDGYGNILTKNGNTYGYINSAWDDLLTHYNGQQITYDAQGNPTTYRGKSLVWEKGRQLKSYGTNSYTYNANGIRTSKTVDGVKHTYILDGTRILKETWGTNTIIPLYDNEDNVCGICYNGTSYYFVKNLQGDVVSLVTKEEVNGEVVYTIVANYTYDAWGKCTVTATSGYAEVANANPYRYRGYYYDVETGLYYLQSRYYDAEVGRFINGDNAEIIDNGSDYNIASLNKYTYCLNAPVNSADECGTIAGTIAKMIGNFFFGMIGSMLGMYLGNVALNVFNKKDNIYKKNDSWGEYIAEGVKSGAFAIFGSKLLLKITAAIGAAIIKQIVDVLIGKKTFNMWGMVVDVIVGVLFVIAIHFSSTMLKKLPKKNRTNEFANRIKSLIKNIGQYITEKIKQILKLLFEFFKTFTKRFSISFAKKCAPQLLKIFR